MIGQSGVQITKSAYDQNACEVGIVHLGFGAFHRAHQAVYIDRLMEETGDLSWGIAAVNLRAEDSDAFQKMTQNDGYLLKTTTPEGDVNYTRIRSHVAFADWARDVEAAEKLLAQPSVQIVSMTVTESGYYLGEDWALDLNDPVISREIAGGERRSIYAYLASALRYRMERIDAPITILCCDNIRANGEKLQANFQAYLRLIKDEELLSWIAQKTTFPNSMVDRITPRATSELGREIASIAPSEATTAIHGESFIQWVLQDKFAANIPNLAKVGVEIVDNVDPYEEAKIRILNGGHTALCYMGALAGHQTFDQTINNPALYNHFIRYEKYNVLPSLTLDLPFDKAAYLDRIVARFSNEAIADDLARICMDGWSKFPIFVRPTLKSCLSNGIEPEAGYESIASWYVYARRFSNQQTHIPYIEPYWDLLQPLLIKGQEEVFAGLETLWSDLPKKYNSFVPGIMAAIEKVEETWPS